MARKANPMTLDEIQTLALLTKAVRDQDKKLPRFRSDLNKIFGSAHITRAVKKGLIEVANPEAKPAIRTTKITPAGRAYVKAYDLIHG